MTATLTITPLDTHLVIRDASGLVLHASWIPAHEDAEQVARETVNALAADERQEAEAA